MSHRIWYFIGIWVVGQLATRFPTFPRSPRSQAASRLLKCGRCCFFPVWSWGCRLVKTNIHTWHNVTIISRRVDSAALVNQCLTALTYWANCAEMVPSPTFEVMGRELVPSALPPHALVRTSQARLNPNRTHRQPG